MFKQSVEDAYFNGEACGWETPETTTHNEIAVFKAAARRHARISPRAKHSRTGLSVAELLLRGRQLLRLHRAAAVHGRAFVTVDVEEVEEHDFARRAIADESVRRAKQ